MGYGTLAEVPDALGRRSIVVDGQQRLTTLLVIIRALVGVADWMELSKEVEGLRALVCNAELEGDWRYKVMPSSEQDLVACRGLMLNPTGDVSVSYGDQLAGRNRINACYDFLSDACENFLRGDDESLAALRLSAVEESILRHLEVAVLNLSDDEQPNMVFETLNARGEELAQHELVKNTVMLEAGVVTDREEARKCWHAFEDGWWAGKFGKGEQIDRFLAAWLTSVRRKNIPPARVSVEFRAFINGWKVDGHDVRDAFEMLNRGGGIYRDVVTGSNSICGDFYARLSGLGSTSLLPVCLWLLEPSNRVPDDSVRKVVEMLESYIFRRTLVKLQPAAHSVFMGVIEVVEGAIAEGREVRVWSVTS